MGIYSKDYINRTLLNEVYFGETKEVKKLQELLSNLRKKCMNDDFVPKINSSDEIQAFNRYCEDMFGFKTFSLLILQTPIENAYTYPISCTFKGLDHLKYFAPTATGMKYKKEANYCTLVYITTGLINNIKYSDREILAMLLHEIGHNFSANFNEVTNLQQATLPFIVVLDAIISVLTLNVAAAKTIISNLGSVSNSYKEFRAEIDEIVYRKLKPLGIAKDTILKFANIILNLNHFLYKKLGKSELVKLVHERRVILNQFLMGFFGLGLTMMNPVSIIRSALSYDNEKLADNFPTLYGYGEDIGTATAKLELCDKSERTALYKKIPVLMQFMNLMQIPSRIAIMLADCHPSAMERMSDQMHMLQRELDKQNLDPKMRKEIERQVKNIDSNIEEYITKAAKLKDIEDPNYMTKCFYTYLQDTCDGDLKTYIMDSDNFQNMDRVYQSKLEQVRFI